MRTINEEISMGYGYLPSSGGERAVNRRIKIEDPSTYQRDGHRSWAHFVVNGVLTLNDGNFFRGFSIRPVGA